MKKIKYTNTTDKIITLRVDNREDQYAPELVSVAPGKDVDLPEGFKHNSSLTVVGYAKEIVVESKKEDVKPKVSKSKKAKKHDDK